MTEEKYTLSPGGQRVYEHEPDNRNEIQIPENSCVYIEEIEAFLDKQFGKRENFVLHEIVSDIVHIDVHVLLPTEKSRRYVLFTSGMSDLPMTLPKEFYPDYKHLERAELMLFLPPDWDVRSSDERNYWPIRLLKELARMPHLHHTWLGYGHSISNGQGNEPYADNTKLCASILIGDSEKSISTNDGSKIQVYSVIPVYRQEMQFKLKNNADKLLDKLIKAKISTTVDIRRKNVCSLF